MDQLVSRLKAYNAELDGIISRFKEDEKGHIFIGEDDDPRFREIVVELIELLADNFPKNDYANPIMNAYNEGIGNWLGSPSLHSVETIRGIVKAAAVRIKSRTPLQQSQKPSPPKPLAVPEKVTVAWLVHNVDYKLWLAAGGLLLGSFMLGVKTSSVVKPLLGL